jgi:hypothetical protein
MDMREALNWSLWRRWVFANAWSELVGLGGSAGAALLLFGVAEPATMPAILVAAAGMVVLPAILEGGVVGLAQWHVLKGELERLSGRRWIFATVLGALVAWILGMIPSTVMSLQEATENIEPPDVGTGLVIGFAFLMGLALGPILAFFQWRVLRGHLPRAGWWIPANAAAWGAGMTIIFAGAGSLPDGASPAQIAGVIALSCLAAGAAVGAIHGLVLIGLLRERRGSLPY